MGKVNQLNDFLLGIEHSDKSMVVVSHSCLLPDKRIQIPHYSQNATYKSLDMSELYLDSFIAVMHDKF